MSVGYALVDMADVTSDSYEVSINASSVSTVAYSMVTGRYSARKCENSTMLTTIGCCVPVVDFGSCPVGRSCVSVSGVSSGGTARVTASRG